MTRSIETRLGRLEAAMAPSPVLRRRILTFSDTCNGSETLRETEQEAIDRHLAAHPEDAGMEFDFIRISWTHGQWNDNGELICEMPGCPNFGKVIKTSSVQGRGGIR